MAELARSSSLLQVLLERGLPANAMVQAQGFSLAAPTFSRASLAPTRQRLLLGLAVKLAAVFVAQERP
jgi:hypothetical protein